MYRKSNLIKPFKTATETNRRTTGDILFNYGPGTQYPRVSGASSLFTGSLAYSIWRGAQGEGEVEDQSRGTDTKLINK